MRSTNTTTSAMEPPFESPVECSGKRKYRKITQISHEKVKGGFPVMAETTRNHIFSKEISQVIIAAMVLAPNFYRKNCLRVISAMRGNPP